MKSTYSMFLYFEKKLTNLNAIIILSINLPHKKYINIYSKFHPGFFKIEYIMKIKNIYFLEFQINFYENKLIAQLLANLIFRLSNHFLILQA